MRLGVQVPLAKRGALVVFNPNTIIDNATWENPHEYPSGISWVIVNGKVAIDHGTWTEILPGKVLKKTP
jgi:N-acyl-D-aspartate/D-glutamate deacylase